ncbi:beta-lactamase class A [Pseudoduganella flava]|uniref:beta-lactamase n=1 Tax=Pseudoduganella flava TaxID=871742 RepID=A0A562PGY1_9BURK|nr:class A beta-lactamase [Pseudoduganella flava]QGZ42492.1 class A beta-lactamase [Pseudoduganella flava]TWI43638.1 beta-lactamase class A [Pseudoduganella flava]
MTISLPRRRLMLAAPLLALPVHRHLLAAPAAGGLADIERDLHGRLGVCALDLGSGKTVGHRQDERFPMCSSFKALLAAQALARAAREPGFLDKRLRYAKADLVSYSPVTEKHVEQGMTVAELCTAVVQVSDNTAANTLMKELGGPAALTAWVRGLGDPTFRLDRWETELNTAIPGDERDTTSPLAMARTLGKLVTGDALPAAQREQLKQWMIGTTTGDRRIRAAAPAGWTVGDKTGTGNYGVTNDIGFLLPPGRAPIVIVVYMHQPALEAKTREDIVAAATRAALAAL